MATKNNSSGVNRRAFMVSVGGATVLGAAGCGGPEEGEAQGTAAMALTQQPTATAAKVFRHPGLLHTQEDFERMRTKVAAQAQPWISGWNALTSSSRSQLDRTPRPLEWVVRGGTDQNFAQLYIDVARSYQLALRWKVSGDERFAAHAVTYLDAWSSTLKGITGNADRYLAAGIYGYQFANAAEIMRTYAGWPAERLARFQQMMLEVFYPLSSRFLREHNDAEITNYWANWDLCNLACVLSVGVLCDREDIYQEALDYFRNGGGNGAGLQAVYHVHPGNLGQWQESGRDQGHCTLGIGLAGALHEMAWNQGDDLYGHDDSRFLAGAEYVARTNLRDAAGNFLAAPYLPNVNRQGTSLGVSPAGQGHLRPVWESVLHHYEGRVGIAAPHVRRQAQQLRPESDGGNGDQLGFGTLTFARDPVIGGAPRSLRVRRQGRQAVLSWWGTPDAVSYNVKRAATAGGPYTTIATGTPEATTFTDTLATASGTWFYVVTAQTASSESAASNEVAVPLAPTLLLHLADAAVLDGQDDFVTLPAGVTTELGDFTIVARVVADEARTWARIFDIGSGTRRYMFLTAKSQTGRPRFEITTVHGYNRQLIDGDVALPVGEWMHLAVTLSGSTGTMYLDGRAIGSNPAISLAPWALGSGMTGWIGKSQYAADPLLKGRVEDFRIYDGALDAAAIAALAAA